MSINKKIIFKLSYGRYSITVSGLGYECYLFRLSNEQYTRVSEFDLSVLSYDDVLYELGFEDLSSSDLIIFGPLENSFKLSIDDEYDENICELLPYQIPSDELLKSHELMLSNHLVYENNISGYFYKLDFFIEEELEFNVNELKLIYTIVGDKKILTSISYKDFDLIDTMECLDYEFIESDIYRVKSL